MPDVAASLFAFCHDGIGTSTLHPLGLRRGCDDRDDLDARGFPHLDIGSRRAGACCYNIDLKVGEELRKFGSLRIHEHDIRADGLAGSCTSFANLILHPRKRSAPTGDDSKTAGLANGRCQ